MSKVAGGFAAVKTESLSPFAVLDDVYTQEALAAPPAANPFMDVKETDWFYPAVMYVYRRGLMTGTAADTFAPAEAVTRAQPPVILYRYAQYEKWDVSVGGDTNILSYPDAFDVSEWAVPAFQWACGAGIVQGDGGRLNPKAGATRAEFAQMLQRLLQTYGG